MSTISPALPVNAQGRGLIAFFKGQMKILTTILMFIICVAAMPLDNVKGEDSAKILSDEFRSNNEKRDSMSVQSNIAYINKERTLYQVNELELANRRHRNMLQTYCIIGTFVVILVIVFVMVKIKKMNDRLSLSRDQMARAQNIAENSMQLKSVFLSNMSHKIRTPLNALSGFSTILAEDTLDVDTRRQFHDIIEENSKLLLKLINDVVDFTSIEKGEMQFTIADHEIVGICRGVVSTVDKGKHTMATLRFDTTLHHLVLHTDVARLQQLLINLLVNATKFTSRGEIVLSLRMVDGNMALFSVADTGCGIGKDKRDKIFNRFEKLDENAQGSGLGLSICRIIAEHLGGQIWVDPKYENGARFCFTHPIN